MIVVADTSPLNYLILIDHIELLPRLYQSVVIPQGVIDELNHILTSEKVKLWVNALPSWVIVRSVVPIPIEGKLGVGEREAIALAQLLDADTILLDDKYARNVAEARGLIVTGTLGVLVLAAQLEEIDLTTALVMLQSTSFHMTAELMQSILQFE